MLAQVHEENRQLRAAQAELSERAAEVQERMRLDGEERSDRRRLEERELEARRRFLLLGESEELAEEVLGEAARLGREEAALLQASSSSSASRAQALEEEVAQWRAAHEALEVRCIRLGVGASARLETAAAALRARLRSQRDEMRRCHRRLEVVADRGEAAEGGSGGAGSSSASPGAMSETGVHEELAELQAQAEALRRGNAEWEAARACHAAAHRAACEGLAAARAEEVGMEDDVRWRELELEQADVRARLRAHAEGLEARLAEMNKEADAIGTGFGAWSEDEYTAYCEELGFATERLAAGDFRLALRSHAVRTEVWEADAREAQGTFLSTILAAWSKEACEARARLLEEELQTAEAESQAEASDVHTFEMELAQMHLQVLAASRHGERLERDVARAAEETEAEEAELEACEAALASEELVHHELAIRNSELLDEVHCLRLRRPEDIPAARALAEVEAAVRQSRAELGAAEGWLEEGRRQEQAQLAALESRVATEGAEVQELSAEAEAVREDVAEGRRQALELERELDAAEAEAEASAERELERQREEEGKVQSLLVAFRNECSLQGAYIAELSAAECAEAEWRPPVAARLCSLTAELHGLRAARRDLDERAEELEAKEREAEAQHRMAMDDAEAAYGLVEAELEQFRSEAEAGQEAIAQAEQCGAGDADAEVAAHAEEAADTDAAAEEELEELNAAISREELLLEEDRELRAKDELRAAVESTVLCDAPASLKACWQVAEALALRVDGELPAEIELAAISAMKEVDPEALVGCLAASAAKPLHDAALAAAFASALQEHAQHLSPLALALASRSLAALSGLDAATHAAIVGASGGDEFEPVE